MFRTRPRRRYVSDEKFLSVSCFEDSVTQSVIGLLRTLRDCHMSGMDEMVEGISSWIDVSGFIGD